MVSATGLSKSGAPCSSFALADPVELFRPGLRQGQVTNILTIDVEDWYHCLDENPDRWSEYEDRIVSQVGRILDILAETGTKATFFVLGHVAQAHPDMVRQIFDIGHEVASHGFEHRFIYQQAESEFEADVRRSVSLLEQIIGTPVLGYRAPYFSVTRKSLWALGALRRIGLLYDSSIFPVVNPRYGIPEAPRLPRRTREGLLELPPTTFPFAGTNVPCAGGVYFRFAPYPVIRKLFRMLNRRRERVVFYLHPWELDARQPRIALPACLKIRHYWGLDRTPKKLRRLLREFRFGAAREVLQL